MKNLGVAFSLLAFMASTQAQASSTAPSCDSQGICTIYRTLKNDKGQSLSMPYSFKYRPAKNGSPTVVYIPGGPGGTSVKNKAKELLPLPEEFGLIQTDPMFTGINKTSAMASFKDATTSEQVAKDILQAVKSVGAADDVIIYGVSYGTIPSTILASKAAKEGVSLRAVVLDGAAGKAIMNDQAVSDYKKEWNLLQEQLGPETMAAFNKVTSDLVDSGELKPGDIGNILAMLLIQRNSENGNAFVSSIVSMGASSPQQLKQILLGINKSLKNWKTPDQDWFHGVIGCKEVFPDSDTDEATLTYKTSLEAAPQIGDCKKYITAKDVKPYDSKNYQINSKVIYLVGENDPATPVWQTRYHAQNQKNMNRSMVVVPNGGHSIINKELQACGESFFLALKRNPDTSVNAFTPCLPMYGGDGYGTARGVQ